MDINSLMNSDAAPARNDREVRDRQDRSVPPHPSHATPSQHASTPPLQQQHFSLRTTSSSYPPAPPTLDTRHSTASGPSTNLTPVRTPSSHSSATPQYPFPQQYQSPVQAQPPRYPAVTPGRMTTYPPLPSPSAFAPPLYPASFSHPSASPQSAQDPSPYGHRESPLAYSHQQPSYPATPLGPPPHSYGRQTTTSPYPVHQRSYSNHSGGNASSPAPPSRGPPSLGLGQPIESPGGFAPPLQVYKRPSAEYLRNGEYSKSPSVSPKTQVMRHPSGDLRTGSIDAWSNRSSLVGHQDMPVRPASSGHAGAPIALARATPDHYIPQISSPLSQNLTQLRRQESLKPSVKNLMSDDFPTPSRQENRVISAEHASQQSASRAGLNEVTAQPQSTSSYDIHTDVDMAMHPGSLLQQPISQPPAAPQVQQSPSKLRKPSWSQNGPGAVVESDQTREPKQKRPAEDEIDIRQERKKARRRYDEPPIWAKRSPRNPYLGKGEAGYQAPSSRNGNQRVAVTPPVQIPAPRPSAPQMNGHTASGSAQPQGEEKARNSQLLQMPWEPTFTDVAPSDELLREVANYLYIEMLRRPDLGAGDTKVGSIEIEAKIGTLVNRGSNDRIRLPVTTMTVLTRDYSRDLRFESFMTEVCSILI